MIMTAAFSKKEFFLKKDGQLSIPIGHLPEGNFSYPVKIINPFRQEIELIFSLSAKNKVQFVQKSNFVASSSTETLRFSVSEKDEWRDIEIIVTLKKGSMARLYLPVSPRLHQNNVTIPATLQDTISKIRSEIETEEKIYGKSSQKKYLRTPATGTQHSEKMQVISPDIFFRGILNLEQAQRQLDYVIYNKLLAPDGTKGFTKWKRSLYRKTVISLYRRLSKNSTRRTYFAKLYRNYINNNIIADNLQAL